MQSRQSEGVEEYSPAGHEVQAPEPGESLYVPTPHAWHVPSSGPVYPGLHRQVTLSDGASELAGHVGDWQLEAPADESLPAGHSMQSDSVLAPSPSMYVPAGRWAPLSVSGLLQNLPHVQLIYQTSD